MATWEDGPEYAPIERPDEFIVPETAALLAPGPQDPPAPAAPLTPPVFTPPTAAVPLAQLVPDRGSGRNGTEPFETSTKFSQSATEQRSPLQPFTTVREVTDPQPGPTAQFLPPGTYAAPQVNPPTFTQMSSRYTAPKATRQTSQKSDVAFTWMLGLLILGMWLQPLAIIAYIGAFFFAIRLPQKDLVLLGMFGIGLILGIMSAFPPLLSYGLDGVWDAWDAASKTMSLACLLTMLASAVTGFIRYRREQQPLP